MKETLPVTTLKDIVTPLIEEISRWVGVSEWQPTTDEREFQRKVWQEVGDDLRGAMKPNTSLACFKNNDPKIYALNSEASILPRRISAAANRCRSSCRSVSTSAV